MLDGSGFCSASRHAYVEPPWERSAAIVCSRLTPAKTARPASGGFEATQAIFCALPRDSRLTTAATIVARCICLLSSPPPGCSRPSARVRPCPSFAPQAYALGQLEEEDDDLQRVTVEKNMHTFGRIVVAIVAGLKALSWQGLLATCPQVLA